MKHAPLTFRQRRGMALLMVLLLLSLTLGLSYAAMRSQSTVGMIQRNSDRGASARQAAITGLTMALKKMHRNDWAGVDTSLSGTLSGTESYLVTYTTGDSRLSAGDPDQPYRATLLSTGYALDSEQPQCIATYRVRAVVKLIPRKLADEPADWSGMLAYTVYQWTAGSFTMMVPSRIEGPVCIQSALDLRSGYPWTTDVYKHYQEGLNGMRLAGQPDYRPFNGPLAINLSAQSGETKDVVQQTLQLTTIDTPARTISSVVFPSALSTYRLYPGGKAYTIPQLPPTLQSATYQADPATNPAGLFSRAGAITVYDNTTINGTLVTTANSGGRIYILGRQVRFAPVNLPPLQGTTQPVQLPAVVSGDAFRVGVNADVAVTGVLAAYLDFQVDSDSQADISMVHLGNLIARNITFYGRSDWPPWSFFWDWEYYAFHAQENNANGIKYFPQWLQWDWGADPKPRLTIKPNPASIRYHWHNPQNTIYVADPSDGGLRWDLLYWAENV